ncbi:hypothetical protein H4Q32_008955 [Labeo rohita]|uniref:Thyroid adenoma-associated-like protein n=1 Tax=Labeo rohita TaxID=84645 RepID=A0ABQ8M4N9_LABRO|nr:hypothetical protein H4Q32_008955 [Labeo rohita]
MTMRSLTALAMPSNDGDTESSSVPQVHALNILRALYRDTRLGENIVPFVSEGMQAAILGFTSPVWAVRNSSTLLFSTLITRIFGVKKGKDEHSKKNRRGNVDTVLTHIHTLSIAAELTVTSDPWPPQGWAGGPRWDPLLRGLLCVSSLISSKSVERELLQECSGAFWD